MVFLSPLDGVYYSEQCHGHSCLWPRHFAQSGSIWIIMVNQCCVCYTAGIAVLWITCFKIRAFIFKQSKNTCTWRIVGEYANQFKFQLFWKNLFHLNMHGEKTYRNWLPRTMQCRRPDARQYKPVPKAFTKILEPGCVTCSHTRYSIQAWLNSEKMPMVHLL